MASFSLPHPRGDRRPWGNRHGDEQCAPWTRVALLSVGGAVPAVAAGWYVWNNLTYSDREKEAVAEAGFIQKQATIAGSELNYAEGPDTGAALLLIHGQVMDWRGWNRVLPELSRRHHVFAVDCYGHGRSARVPEKYRATALAADLREFLTQVVGGPAIVAGHSSGGLIAASLAADAPALVSRVVLEDPPFFSSVLPRAEKTFNDVDLATPAHEYLHSGERDFTAYYLQHGKMLDSFGEKIRKSALSYRRKHPGKPVELCYLPPAFNELFRAMDCYDPRFGDAFYDNSFHRDFDHAAVLSRITVPALLIHTNWSYDADGILLAAMSGEDAERARSLLRDVEFHKVGSGHNFHFEDPRRFTRLVLAFTKRVPE
ncbi:alpha/beta fold hydrolase [Amycolatopsis alkalitolerans]|uniref:Alpha/beta hydrolase n=1 Tax=Amycolatopsis alkalitolerans TaxID=2547244 RepID=A0A5C4M713_9PSEU|nr:alpha/beta hydrolase [Amycolatopsis alkalitolerans]TNC29054.1 alpha/beta hydrolase [Amycolatopsis alkalitolerans]